MNNQIRRLQMVAQAAQYVHDHLKKDHKCIRGGACWECCLAGVLSDALEDLCPGDLDAKKG